MEGAELSVLRGGIELIKKDQPVIVFEHSLDAAREYGALPEEIYDLLSEEGGLELSLMERWLMGEIPYTRQEFCRAGYSYAEFYFVAYPSYLRKPNALATNSTKMPHRAGSTTKCSVFAQNPRTDVLNVNAA